MWLPRLSVALAHASAVLDEYIDVRAAPVEDYEERFQPPFTGYIPQFNVAAY